MYEQIKKLSVTTQLLDALLRVRNRVAAPEQCLPAPDTENPEISSDLRELKVAAIMDSYTWECFGPECRLKGLTPNEWEAELTAFQPDLLFMVSDWEEKDNPWCGMITRCTADVYAVTEYCHTHNIPVVFWNKEDPGFADTFIPAAKCADYVFTADLECVEKYKAVLKHERVYHLHFAAQPCLHNPILSQASVPSYAGFPESCGPNIEHSITQNQTMFDRRVFEMMASNTIVVGNYSRGVKNYFGDLTVCTDDDKTMGAALARYSGEPETADKLRLLALRKVLIEHLMADRLGYVAHKVLGRKDKTALPKVTVYAHVKNQLAAERIMHMFQCQRHKEKRLILISNKKLQTPPDVCVVKRWKFRCQRVSEICGEGYLAYFHADDWYGENYLLDLVLATRYGTFPIIGKAQYYTAATGKPVRTTEKMSYCRVIELAARRCIVSAELASCLTGADLRKDQIWCHEDAVSVDTMNYCESWRQKECAAAEDMVMPDQGISLEEIELAAERMHPLKVGDESVWVGDVEIEKMQIREHLPIRLEWQGNHLHIISELPEETHSYGFLNGQFEIADCMRDGVLRILFRGKPRMKISGFCLFYDETGKKIGNQSFKLGIEGEVTPPAGTAYMQFAYRLMGSGSAELGSIEFGTKIVNSLRGGCFLSRSNVLVLTNHYPAPDDLYRNMFVHNRLAIYKAQGALVDVMRMNRYTKDILREFEGINVIEGQKDMLTTILSDGSIDTVCVHFLSDAMWDVLKDYLHKIRLIIWTHGADIQPWWRRVFLYQTEEDLEKAKRVSDARMALWQKVFEASENADIQFVFVSQFFCDQVLEDYRVELPKEKYQIIHNCIDTEQFSYVPKKPEDRLKLLSIRPYANAVYANDLTVKAILELVNEPWFPELEIAIYGRGPLFDEVLEPLRQYPNIHIEETFLTHSEIAAIHKNYGVFLTPSRMDTQGVSRDEAMSSGLVPITTAVAAIPEFTDENCAIVVPAEDYKAIADGIRFLYHHPDEYLRLSENAAKRVRSQTSPEFTINKELQLIFGK